MNPDRDEAAERALASLQDALDARRRAPLHGSDPCGDGASPARLLRAVEALERGPRLPLGRADATSVLPAVAAAAAAAVLLLALLPTGRGSQPSLSVESAAVLETWSPPAPALSTVGRTEAVGPDGSRLRRRAAQDARGTRRATLVHQHSQGSPDSPIYVRLTTVVDRRTRP